LKTKNEVFSSISLPVSVSHLCGQGKSTGQWNHVKWQLRQGVKPFKLFSNIFKYNKPIFLAFPEEFAITNIFL
jgi:hypothetical protein